ncbi:hypothetical protein NS228_22520 [Methylobacterium indicum]|uniref:TSUP family transporter n=1 Tax=Methylobacterium indicum TaxID=1775910 RepID=UPI0007341385|nr:TSUP family transporter [Methylobacterium indicum]KTS29496.1 hypothetical protein NS229_16765 [Methylobacterium indicum]KTS31659.1 hypothetical protein NS228_22520 [Methylobacterium indicum]KTS50279.1 hypothetical protein NS230_16210 [Methylobacterium indicum]
MALPALSVLAFIGVTFLAAAFRGVTGFGYSLIAALGLGLLPSAQVGIPFLLGADLVLTALLLFSRLALAGQRFACLGSCCVADFCRRTGVHFGDICLDRRGVSVDWRVLRPLLAAGLLGAACGGPLAVGLDETTARLVVTVAVLGAAGVALVRRPPAWLADRRIGIAVAALVGGLISAFAVGGPLISAWLLASGAERHRLKGTLAVFFGAADVLGLAGRGLLGAIEPGLWDLVLLYGVPTLLGFATGTLLSARLSPEAWRRLASGGLAGIAATGLVQALVQALGKAFVALGHG